MTALRMTAKCPKCAGLLVYAEEYPAMRCVNCGRLFYSFIPRGEPRGRATQATLPGIENPGIQGCLARSEIGF